MSTALARRSEGVWAAAWRRMKADKVGIGAMFVVIACLVLVLGTLTGVVASGWQREVAVPNAPPTLMGPAPAEDLGTVAAQQGPSLDISDIDPLAPKYKEWAERAKTYATAERPRDLTRPLGGDRLGRDVLEKVLKGSQVSIVVGLLAAVIATLIGTVLGAISGFFGGKIGDILEWLYNVFTAMPDILLIFAFAAVLGRGIVPVAMILALTGWTGIYRLIRAEFMKHSVREYVRSAEAIGASRFSRMFKHILPNVSHVALVQLSLHVVGFIKYEVILSYLGLGVSVDQVSWGTMLQEAQSELILGYWWQLAAVTGMMAIFVTGFALFTDALRDALDPKLRGLE
ncbi:MAG: ABC transporter permease [Paucibacter sp.]|nr:ABC transporter permease [Roseateles sp.]